MAEQKYYTIVTDLGTKLIAKAAQNGTKVNITHIAAGDGNGIFYQPTSDMTALKREIWRGEIQNYEIDALAKNVIKVSGVIPKEVGHFVLREMALFDDKNNMIAVCNAPDLLKAVLEDGALTEAVVYMRIAVTNTEAVTIQVNGSAVYATLQELEAHKKDTTAHQELLEQKADKTEVETALAEKVDTTTFTTELNKKANKADVETALAGKVDNATVTTELNKKVDKTDFTGANIGNLLEQAGWESGSDMTATEILEALKTVDGTDSGLDADLLNGKKALSHHNYTTNLAIGNNAFSYGITKDSGGNYNTAIGTMALTSLIDGDFNLVLGASAMQLSKYASNNIAIGQAALNGLGIDNTSNKNNNQNNVAVGINAASKVGDFSNCTALGYNSLKNTVAYSNCTGLGANSAVTGANQVQLGDTTVTVYAQSAIQTRSDARDKTDIQNTKLGLAFIKKLTPRQFRRNSREAYFEQDKKRDFTVKNDGSKAGKRFHQGFVAQEVKMVMEEMGIDFAGYQDHKINGGEDVLSLGYTEFIAPVVKAIQEQQEIIEGQQNKIAWLEQKINEVMVWQQGNILQS